MKRPLDKLINFLRGVLKEINVVVMPDFFHDRLITLGQTPSQFALTVQDCASRKGGSIDDILQADIRGGNAANTASALAALGINVKTIISTDKAGLERLNSTLQPLGVDTSHVKVAAKPSITTALEFSGDEGKVNVMLRDLGSLADFGPAEFSDYDFDVIKEADYVCVFNWAGTRNHGTELAQKIFSAVKTRGKGKTYFDTADPMPNRKRIHDLMEKVMKTSQIDILSLNENEAITYAGYLRNGTTPRENELPSDEQALESARVLAKRLQARIDLHTTTFSATFKKEAETVIPAFKIKPLRATGAGDAWNAGNILADANGLNDECRLTLANAVSGCYLTDPSGVHPTRKDVIRFLKQKC